MRGVSSSHESVVTFEALRGRLFGLAYRMLGSRADAEDIVQEAYVRWHQAAQESIENPEAWLVTATTRLAIDRLRRLKTEREAYVGPWLPEPIVTDDPPDRHLELADDLSIAFLALLERLAPEERAAFLLHDVFDVGYPQIAAVVDRSEAACRQIVHRARERVRGDRKRFEVAETVKASLLQKFMAAVESRDEQALLGAVCARRHLDGGRRWPGRSGPAPDRRRRPHRAAGGRAAREVLGAGPHPGDRHRQRRNRPAHPRRQSPDGGDIDRHRRQPHPRRLRGDQPGQARLAVTPTCRKRLRCR